MSLWYYRKCKSCTKGFGWICITFCHLLCSKPLQRVSAGQLKAEASVPYQSQPQSGRQLFPDNNVLTGNSLSVLRAKTRHATAGKNVINAVYLVFRGFGWAWVSIYIMIIINYFLMSLITSFIKIILYCIIIIIRKIMPEYLWNYSVEEMCVLYLLSDILRKALFLNHMWLTVVERMINLKCHFTIQENVIVYRSDLYWSHHLSLLLHVILNTLYIYLVSYQ